MTGRQPRRVTQLSMRLRATKASRPHGWPRLPALEETLDTGPLDARCRTSPPLAISFAMETTTSTCRMKPCQSPTRRPPDRWRATNTFRFTLVIVVLRLRFPGGWRMRNRMHPPWQHLLQATGGCDQLLPYPAATDNCRHRRAHRSGASTMHTNRATVSPRGR